MTLNHSPSLLFLLYLRLKVPFNNFQTAQADDPICSQVIEYCHSTCTWPNKHRISLSLHPYWEARCQISVVDNLLLYGSLIVVPASLHISTIEKIQHGHLGIQKCPSRAQNSVWWPGCTQQIKHAVENCKQCAALSTNRREPLISSTLPQFPWQVVGADIFQLKDVYYLLVVDYYSRNLEAIKLSSMTSSAVITSLKSVFSRHGIPEILSSDNRPQFHSYEMSDFASSYGFQQQTSSPHHPQSNGQAGRAIQTVKRLLKKSSVPYMALLIYRFTPLSWCEYSPAELLMGHRLRANLPLVKEQLMSNWPYLPDFHHKDQEYKRKQKVNYDSRHHANSLPHLSDDSLAYIWTKDKQVTGTIVKSTPEPRSYTSGDTECYSSLKSIRSCPSPSRYYPIDNHQLKIWSKYTDDCFSLYPIAQLWQDQKLAQSLIHLKNWLIEKRRVVLFEHYWCIIWTLHVLFVAVLWAASIVHLCNLYCVWDSCRLYCACL